MSTTNPAEYLFDAPASKNTRNITTPEGVIIPVELASVWDRAGAFVIDFVILLVPPILIMGLMTLVGGNRGAGGVLTALLYLVAFISRVTYFIQFELIWNGATPGKRIVGLRVIDRRGGPLQPSAVVARNLTREFEVFVPLSVLMSIGSLDAGSMGQWLSGIWVVVIGALPLLNRDSMRGGDLIAGTIVIRMTTRKLAKDIANSEFHFTFTDQHLSAYGNFELQVLEELLRRHGHGIAGYSKLGVNATQAQRASLEGKQMLHEVCEKICKKIDWLEPVPPEQELQFLKDFYTAERAFLERGQLFGMVKADKHQERKRQEVPPTEHEH